ncbi:MAG: c-type cytochrome [Clostridia bacterium]|nr:c-type cytochrome [Clostridia bacterium]
MKNRTLRTRLLSIAIIAIILATVAAATVYKDSYTAPADSKVNNGDVTGDGTVTLSDAEKLISLLAAGTATADVTGDGKVNLADALTLIRKVVSGYKRSDVSGTEIIATATKSADADSSAYTSVNGITLLGESIYVSDETGMNVYKLAPNGAKQGKYSANAAVNSVITDGKDVYSLEGGLCGRVVKLSADLEVLSSCDAGHTPTDMAITGGKGYVTNRFSNTVSVIDLEKMQLVKTIEIDAREPIAAVAAGSDIYVACHLPDESMSESVVSANVIVISRTSDSVTESIPLVNGASGVKDICASPDGKTVYLSHVIGRYAYPTTQLDRGWINTNGFSVIDTYYKKVSYTCLLDEVDDGAANPWGITVSGDGRYLCVALSGLDEIMKIDIPAMQQKANAVKNMSRSISIESLDDIVNYLPFLDGCRTRISVGKGVRAVTEKNGLLYCGTYFDGTVDIVDLRTNTVSRIAVAAQPAPSEVRKGQILWSDANNCYQRWQSCNSCHPDAIVDGFNWDNLNDGLGNGKSAKSMLYSHRTPPVMITGIRKDAETAVAAGMKFIQFNTLSSLELSYIDEYLKSLSPIPSPALSRDGMLSESAKSGEALFDKNCASCHPAPLYTDMKKHDVGTSKLEREDGNFDTPTLIEVWRTAPYLHNGEFNTVEEVIRHFAKKLSDTEVKNLADYVRSIGDEGEYYGAEQIMGTKNGEEFCNTYIGGMQLKSMSVRYQNEFASDRVIMALSVYNGKGTQVFYCDTLLPAMNLNSLSLITFGEGIVLPEGGYYTVAFFDEASGKPVSSVLKIS